MQSAVAADFDLLAGSIVAGQQALVVRGFEIAMSGALDNPATALQVEVAGAALLHPLASENGTIFAVAPDAPAEVLSISNPRIIGGFTASAVNYIGVDLRRQADASTSDVVMIIDASTKLETPKTVPLARTLDFVIVISTTDFGSTPHICPIAKVETNASNTVVKVEDARQMFFRLGSGGANPDRNALFSWLGGRTETSESATTSAPNPNLFTNGDKVISSLKGSLDAIMNRLWELGGGEHWYSPTSDRELKVAFTSAVLSSGRNAEWNLGTNTLQWKGIIVTFANSLAWYNEVRDGSITLADGECLYVDIDRVNNRFGSSGSTASVVPAKAPLATLGTPVIPGSRLVLAWRLGSDVFLKDYPFDVSRSIGVPPPAGDPLNVLLEGENGVHYWGRITDDMILSILKVNSFAPTVTRYEKGATVATPSFTASYLNGSPTLATLTDDQGTAPKDVSSTPTSFTSNATFTKSNVGINPIVTFTLTADAGDTPSSKSSTIQWTRFFYWGVDASPSPTINEAWVKGLASTTGGDKVLNPTKNQTVQMIGGNAPTNKYVYFAYPAYYGDVSKIVDNLTGFTVFQNGTGAFVKMPGTVTVTVEGVGGIGEAYNVYRTVQAQNGNVDFTVS